MSASRKILSLMRLVVFRVLLVQGPLRRPRRPRRLRPRKYLSKRANHGQSQSLRAWRACRLDVRRLSAEEGRGGGRLSVEKGRGGGRLVAEEGRGRGHLVAEKEEGRVRNGVLHSEVPRETTTGEPGGLGTSLALIWTTPRGLWRNCTSSYRLLNRSYVPRTPR